MQLISTFCVYRSIDKRAMIKETTYDLALRAKQIKDKFI